MSTLRSLHWLAGLTLLCAGLAHAQASLDTKDGMLVDQDGMTVYTYDKDVANSGKSVCNDACAKAWPPVSAAADAKADGDYTIVTRSDGSTQWAYKGQPLYTFVKDKQAGDKVGDNVKEVWHVVKP